LQIVAANKTSWRFHNPYENFGRQLPGFHHPGCGLPYGTTYALRIPCQQRMAVPPTYLRYLLVLWRKR